MTCFGESLWNVIDTCDPDIIIGCETWLSDSHTDSEILPPGYKPYRNNRADGYGGVLIATKQDLISEEAPVTTNTELVAAKIQLANSKNLIICAAYRPPKEDLQYTE